MSDETSDTALVVDSHVESEALPQEIAEKVEVKTVGKDPYQLVHEAPGLRVRAMQIKTGVVLLTESYDLASQVFIPGATLRKNGSTVEVV